MKQALGLPIPETLEDICTPSRCALILYDMQVGIVPQVPSGPEVLANCQQLLAAARDAGFRVFFTRHFFLPNKLAGVGQFRRAMIWQHASDPTATHPLFVQGTPSFEIVPELAPQEGEIAIDKITMSAFEATFLNIALRDAQIDSFLIAGIALEVGIEPTVRQSMDLNYIPIVVTDACGSRTAELGERSLATLNETGEALMTTTADVIALMRKW